MAREKHTKCDRCDRCGFGLEDGRSVQWFSKDGSLIETVCEECDSDERKLEYRKTGRITSRLHLDAVVRRGITRENCRIDRTYQAVLDDMEKVGEVAKGFNKNVWLSGLRKRYMDAKENGHSAKAGTTKFMVFCMAGRILLTFEREGGDYLTLITSDEEPPRGLGVQGIGCREYVARDMICDVSVAWEVGKLDFKPDSEVSLI